MRLQSATGARALPTLAAAAATALLVTLPPALQAQTRAGGASPAADSGVRAAAATDAALGFRALRAVRAGGPIRLDGVLDEGAC